MSSKSGSFWTRNPKMNDLTYLWDVARSWGVNPSEVAKSKDGAKSVYMAAFHKAQETHPELKRGDEIPVGPRFKPEFRWYEPGKEYYLRRDLLEEMKERVRRIETSDHRVSREVDVEKLLERFQQFESQVDIPQDAAAAEVLQKTLWAFLKVIGLQNGRWTGKGFLREVDVCKYDNNPSTEQEKKQKPERKITVRKVKEEFKPQFLMLRQMILKGDSACASISPDTWEKIEWMKNVLENELNPQDSSFFEISILRLFRELGDQDDAPLDKKWKGESVLYVINPTEPEPFRQKYEHGDEYSLMYELVEQLRDFLLVEGRPDDLAQEVQTFEDAASHPWSIKSKHHKDLVDDALIKLIKWSDLADDKGTSWLFKYRFCSSRYLKQIDNERDQRNGTSNGNGKPVITDDLDQNVSNVLAAMNSHRGPGGRKPKRIRRGPDDKRPQGAAKKSKKDKDGGKGGKKSKKERGQAKRNAKHLVS